MKKRSLAFAILLLVGAGCAKVEITSFEECAAAGNPVMESYPRQCRADGKTFVESVPTEPEGYLGDSSASQDVTWKVGETHTLESGIVITLVAIDDSRCPKDVQCVWAGELAAVLSLKLYDSEAPAVEMRLGQTTKPKDEAMGYSLELVTISETEATILVTKL